MKWTELPNEFWRENLVLKVVVGAIVIIIACSLVIWWAVENMFAPIQRTVEIEISPGKTLICQETDIGDFSSGELYLVDFSLVDGDKDEIELGDGIFSNAKWDTTLVLSEFDDWLVLPVEERGYSKILLANVRTGLKKDTTFFPINLKGDSLWMAKIGDVPDDHYGGFSRVESIRKNRFSVAYNYRTRDDDVAPRYNQVCTYEFDSLKGKFVTREIMDRKPEER